MRDFRDRASSRYGLERCNQEVGTRPPRLSSRGRCFRFSIRFVVDGDSGHHDFKHVTREVRCGSREIDIHGQLFHVEDPL